MIKADLAPFVDDDERVGERWFAQQAIEQGRLAGAEKTGDDIDRNRGSVHGPVGISLPTKTGAPDG